MTTTENYQKLPNFTNFTKISKNVKILEKVTISEHFRKFQKSNICTYQSESKIDVKHD